MTFFFDENFPKKTKDLLENHGHSWIDIRGTEDEGLPDIDLFEIAKANEAVFLTTDKDFYHTVHFESKPHFGIVVIALSKPNSRSFISKVEWFLEHFGGEDLKDKCFLIKDTVCRIYS